MTKGGVWMPGHDWQSPEQRRQAAIARQRAADPPPSRWDDPAWSPEPAPELIEARTRLAVLREAGEW